MNLIDVIIPIEWNGLPVYLKNISTSSDNKFLNDGDIGLLVDLITVEPQQYIKENDLVLLESNNPKYASHSFVYTITDGKHTFTPLSNFLGRETLVYDSLNDVIILGKMLCSFRDQSEQIEFKTIIE